MPDKTKRITSDRLPLGEWPVQSDTRRCWRWDNTNHVSMTLWVSKPDRTTDSLLQIIWEQEGSPEFPEWGIYYKVPAFDWDMAEEFGDVTLHVSMRSTGDSGYGIFPNELAHWLLASGWEHDQEHVPM